MGTILKVRGRQAARRLPRRSRFWGLIPVEGRVPPERVYADMLLREAVQEDRQGREADVVQRQVGGVVQGLQGTAPRPHKRFHVLLGHTHL